MNKENSFDLNYEIAKYEIITGVISRRSTATTVSFP